jgi:lipid II:glycine glycyltransferase (peptidoglycan interpeptide bridge formation enzyme)
MGSVSNHRKTPFHNPKWPESVRKVYGIKNFSIKEKNSEIVFFLIPKFGKKLVSIPYCDYGGFDLVAWNFNFRELNKIAKKHKVDYVEIRGPRKILEKKLEKHKFVNYETYDLFSLKLGDTEKVLWDSLDKKVRNSVRKANKSGLIVRKSNDLKAFYKLYKKTMKRHGSPHHSLKFFKEIHKNFRTKFMFAEKDGKKIAVSLFIIGNKKIYYLVNASAIEYLAMNPNDLIIHEMALWGIKNNFDSIELGRSRPNDGTHFFKKKWSNEKGEIKYYVKFYKKKDVPDPKSKKYVGLRRVWVSLPMFVTNFLGPKIRKYFP